MSAAVTVLRRIAARQDLVLVVLLMLIIFMIILPLPTALLDFLIGLNLALSLLILIVCVYLPNPTVFSTLPAVILFATLFRLAISIATTRMILLHADAGHIVATFGDFVLGGNIVVGIVVFLIITIVQFLVITKGSERVAEVSARFSLDALPGRQMSIDSDMRAGEIDMDEARRRRLALQLESEFYGAMDGAMKYVKGDAIAGLVVIVVNLLGGIGIGVGQQGMGFDKAGALYSVLTVGDGMVQQIPALLLSIASGFVITRVSQTESRDLGGDILRQIAFSPRALQVSGVILLGFAAIPGFPAPVFLLLALVFGSAGLVAERRRRRDLAEDPAPAGGGRKTDVAITPAAPVHVRVGSAIHEGLDRQAFRAAALAERSALFEAIGVAFPEMVLEVSPGLQPDRWQLRVEDVPVAEGTIPPASLRLMDDGDAARILGLTPQEVVLAPTETRSLWLPAADASVLARAGLAFQSPERALAHLAAERLPRHAADFLGVQEVGALLAAMEPRYGSLVSEAQKALPLQKIAAILRRLVEEQIPVRNLRIVLETLVEWAPREKDIELLSEYVRAALARQISHRYADEDRMIPAWVLEADIEEMIRGAVRQSPSGVFLALEAQQSRRLLETLRAAAGDRADHRVPPVFLTSTEARRFLRRFLSNHQIDFPVLSHKEIAPAYKVYPLAMLSLK